MNLISCSIVCYKTPRKRLEKVVSSLLNSSLDVKIYLIDNSPNDEISNWFNNTKIEYVFNNSNIGFGAAHNIAIKKAINSSKYHLVLNPDIYFDKDVLEKVCSFMEENKEIGLLVPKILYIDGTTQFLCKLMPTPLDLFIRRFIPFKSLLEKQNYLYELKFTGYDKIMDVPVLSGCCMFLRTNILSSVGLFDDRFFMYMEDVDLCRRIGHKFRTVYYPFAVVYHEYEKGSYKNFRLLKHHLRSAVRYFNKWGWFFDKERIKINKKTLSDLSYYKK